MSDKGRQLNILWLWPDILNLHGDRGNVMALIRICGLYGIDARITRVSRITDDFVFENMDIALLGAGELAVMPQIAGALSKKYAKLKSWTENGGILFATGTTGATLGIRTLRLDGSHIFGVGLLGMECRERREILGDDLIYRTRDGMDIYGIQIHMMDIALADGQAPFGNTVYGYGNNGGGAEGAVQGNVFFTNALGPVLVKNPWLTLELINRALAARGGGDCSALDLNTARHRGLATEPGPMLSPSPSPLCFDPELFRLELASAKAIRAFNEKKEKPKWVQS